LIGSVGACCVCKSRTTGTAALQRTYIAPAEIIATIAPNVELGDKFWDKESTCVRVASTAPLAPEERQIYYLVVDFNDIAAGQRR
jgi:hypothetical protein